MTDERRERYAAELLRVWREADWDVGEHDLADAAMAVADAENARLRAELAALQEKDDTVLSEAERDMLGFALSQAQEVMDSRSAEFTADDHAAWGKLRRLAD